MHKASRSVWFVAIAVVCGCGFVSSLGPMPVLFPTSAGVESVDFEQDSLNQTPDGFDVKLGRWVIADSPTAASGNQVLVCGGSGAASLAVKNAEAADTAGGEVAVRVFLGAPGAGLACNGAEGGGTGYFLRLEPASGRIALYRKNGEALTLVGQTPLATPKGEWARIGIRCEDDRVIGYVDGKPKISEGAGLSTFDLALWADPGVTAQFDDLRYWSKK